MMNDATVMLGYFLMALPFIAFIWYTTREVGLKVATIFWLILGSCFFCIFGGFYLTTGGT